MIDFKTVVALFCFFTAFNLGLRLLEMALRKWRNYSVKDLLLAVTLFAVAVILIVIMPKEN